MQFNRSAVVHGTGPALVAGKDEIENTPTLRQASLELAVRYGGTLTKRALGVLPIAGDHRYTIVDTKVSYLMPGWTPSIPGWHTDGVPRGDSLTPDDKGEPNIRAQSVASQYGDFFQANRHLSAPRYHLLHVSSGTFSPTYFLTERNIDLIGLEKMGRNLYADMTRQVDLLRGSGEVNRYAVVDGLPITWDWWEIHSASPATRTGWRFLIRVTETDAIPPRTDLNQVMRFQNQVYVPGTEVGW